MNRRVWEANYPEMDRRGHNHRCIACNKIMKTGEPALWVRPASNPRKTKVAHIECADAPWTHTQAGWTFRKSFEAWSTEA